MKRLFAILMALCLCLAMCACNNEQPEANTPTDASVENNATQAPQDTATEDVTPETTIPVVEIPENLKCVCMTGEHFRTYRILTDENAQTAYKTLLESLPNRAKSNPAYKCEGDSFLLVFYDGPEFDGDWYEDFTYFATLEVAENGVVLQAQSPFNNTTLNFKLSADLYSFVYDIYHSQDASE